MAGNQTAGARTASNTLQANTVDLVYLTDPGSGVSVMNDSNTAHIWFTVSHPGGPCPVPTVNGANCFCAASVATSPVNVRHPGQAGSIVQLISPGTPSYTVSVIGGVTNG